MYDENPHTNSAPNAYNYEGPIENMLQMEDEGGFFWACPKCETDAYMRDGIIPGTCKSLDALAGYAASHIEDLRSGLDEGLYEDGTDEIRQYEAIDVDTLRSCLQRECAAEAVAVAYNEDHIDALEAMEQMREIFHLK